MTHAPVIATCLEAHWRYRVLDRSVRAVLEHAGPVIDLAPATLEPADGTTADLASVRVLVTGWGAPELGDAVLNRFPALELVAHAAGSVRGIVTDAVWRRGIRTASAVAANAEPVADFTLAQVQLALKGMWRTMSTSGHPAADGRDVVRGADGATIGLIGLGHIGRRVASRLADRPVSVIAYDPHADPVAAAAQGLRLVELTELMRTADVVSVHAPLTPETRGMIDGPLLSTLRPGATFINTARGGLVDTDALSRVAATRPDLTVLLDVTDPEPLPPRHPLLSLPNVFITPHIAGSLGSELPRLGRLAAEDAARHLSGQPLRHAVDEHALARSA